MAMIRTYGFIDTFLSVNARDPLVIRKVSIHQTRLRLPLSCFCQYRGGLEARQSKGRPVGSITGSRAAARWLGKPSGTDVCAGKIHERGWKRKASWDENRRHPAPYGGPSIVTASPSPPTTRCSQHHPFRFRAQLLCERISAIPVSLSHCLSPL
jgi:hypothetical protein